MWQKAFHVVLITFLVLFSAAGLVLLMSGLSTLLFAGTGSHDTVFAYSGGLSVPLIKIGGLLVLFTSVLIISLVARRKRLR